MKSMLKTNMKATRKDRLLPNGLPRYVRCYDNGGTDKPGGSIDRYTAVFTGNYRKKTGGEFLYIGMNGSPFDPQGFGQHGSHSSRIDRPRHRHIGKRIGFLDLPQDCRILVLHDYLDLWDLTTDSEAAWVDARAMVAEREKRNAGVPY